MAENKGIVFVVDGAGGSGFLPFVLNGILANSTYKMRHFRWSAGYMRIIKDLTNREINRKRASELSREIMDYRVRHPDHSIHLIGKSAGTAIVLWAMCDLEANILDRVILLSPAVSPDFPLEKALPAARLDVYSFWSPYDLFFLGLGTSLFGTADGARGKSAGLVGFRRLSETESSEGTQGGEVSQISRVAATGKPRLRRLKEVKWDPSMVGSMHLGDHSGTSMPPFIRKYVLPLLSSES